MNYSINPFQELYVADTVSQDHFVQLFSRVPMEALTEFHQLFQKGNVVLLGSQGCGKTMLLTLFRRRFEKPTRIWMSGFLSRRITHGFFRQESI